MKLTALLAVASLMALAAVSGAQAKAPPARPPQKKSTPLRDPKTGKFEKTCDKNAKKGPMRDPKTGRIVNSKP